MSTSTASYRAKETTFRYTATAEQGRTVKGTIKAASEMAAQNLLVEQGYSPISLEAAPPFFSLETQLPSLYGVKQREVINFSRQLATLLASGLTLLPAIQLLAQQSSNSGPFRRILGRVVTDLGSGLSLSQAISRHGTVFNEIYYKTLAVGERTGRIEEVLRELAEHMEKQSAFTKKVSGALTYPMIVLVAGVGVGAILLTVALPPMVEMFDAMSVDLPLPTRILIGISNFVNTFKLYLASALVAAVAGSLVMTRRPSGRRALDRVRLRAPVIGPPYHMAELARICRTMAMMLNAGVSLQEVVDMLPQTSRNRLIIEALYSIRRGLFLGQGLAYPMALQHVFPPLLVQMVLVGEESNSLETNMRVVADFYESTAEEKTEAFLSFIQPVSTMLIALVAGFVALSVVMPMYSLTSGF